MRFSGKVAIVTGAASGIGRACAVALAREGAAVLAADLDAAGLQGTVAAGPEDAEIATFEGDLADGDTVRRLVAEAIDRWGRIDIAHLNAGIQGPLGPIHRIDERDYDRVMAANARSVFLGLRHVLPSMLERRSGAIVVTCSVAALGGIANLPAYVASKHAALGLVRAAAMDVAESGVRVNAICPGAVETPMLESVLRTVRPDAPRAAADAFAASSPVRRLLSTGEIADATLFLASDAAGGITGTVLAVDGGLATRIGGATRSA